MPWNGVHFFGNFYTASLKNPVVLLHPCMQKRSAMLG
jgi:hypothetical protein